MPTDEREPVPYVGFGNDSLDKLPSVSEGTVITCRMCGAVHTLECGTDSKTKEKTTLIMFYRCGEQIYLGAVAGKLIAGVKADCSGKMSL